MLHKKAMCASDVVVRARLRALNATEKAGILLRLQAAGLLVSDAVAVGMDLPMIQVIGKTAPGASRVPTAAELALLIDHS
jgi:hypothetical protein